MVLWPAAGLAAAQDKLELTIEAKGNSAEAVLKTAREQAAREAVQRIAPPPAGKEEQVAHERLLTAAQQQAERLVRVTPLDGPREKIGAPWYVKIKAEVDRAELEKLRGGEQQTVRDEPPPTIMVVISREEHRRERPEPFHILWEIRPDSKVAAAVESVLVQAGYPVKNATQFLANQDRKVDFAKLDGDSLKIIQGLAAEQGADLILHIHAKADGPNPQRLEGSDDVWYRWHSDATARLLWADTAEYVCSIPVTDGGDGLDQTRDGGAEEALGRAGEKIAREVVKHLTAAPRRAEIKVDVLNVKKIAQGRAVLEWIKRVPGVDGARDQMARQVMYVRVKTKMGVRELAEALETWRDPASEQELVVDEFRANTVRMKLVPK